MHDGVVFVPEPDQPSPLDAFLVYRCGWCSIVWFHAPRCLCGAPTPQEVGGGG